MAAFQTLTGFRDLLPPDTDRWRSLLGRFAEHAGRAGFGEVVPPMMEDLAVFLRIGDSTDVVTKEMYDFVDKDGSRIALRPEFTASLARIFVQRRPPVLPWKVWSWGPVFRHEKPQAGRFRQFMQFDAECIGSNDPDVDVEIIALANDFFLDLGLQQFTIRLNSLGDEGTRVPYLEALHTYFSSRASDLSAQSRSTLEKNPLRLLDSKREQDQPVIAEAPRIADFLGGEVREHFECVQAGLHAVGIAFVIDPRLVRGLDYYTHTLFEFAATSLDSAQNAIGGGGHYNNLVEQLGGPSTPGIGFGLGIDRILMACDAEGVFATPEVKPDVFIAGTGPLVSVLTARCRRAGIAVERAFDGRSMKAQGKMAGKSGAQFVVTVEEGAVWVKDFGVGGERAPVESARVPGVMGAMGVVRDDYRGFAVDPEHLDGAIKFLQNQYR